jgi:hypothetical protein
MANQKGKTILVLKGKTNHTICSLLSTVNWIGSGGLTLQQES